MMEKLRKISTMYYLKQIVACLLVYCMLLAVPMQVALAEVVQTSSWPDPGSVTVTPLGGGTTQNMTADNGAIGNFSDFDIAALHSVTCAQPTNGNALFKVFGDGTEILGNFTANGNIYLIDPAGILFGPNSQINVNKLVASGLNMTDQDFLDFTGGQITKMKFQGGLGGVGSGAGVTNLGTINAVDSAYLVGTQVLNTGTITSPIAVLAAGEKVFLAHLGSNVFVEMASDLETPVLADNTTNTVANSDTFNATGDVLLAAGDIYSTAISGVGKLAAVANRNIGLYGDFIAGEMTITADFDDSGGVEGGYVYATGATIGTSGSLTSTTGDIDISASDNTILLDVDIDAAEDFLLNNNTVVTPSKTLHAGSDVILAAEKTLYGEGDLIITAGSNIMLGDDLSDSDPTVGDAGNVIVQGNLTLDAGDDIYAHGQLITDTLDDYDGVGANIDLTASGEDTIHLFGDVTADLFDGGSIFLHNNTQVASGVTLKAGLDVTLDDNKTMTGLGPLTIEGDRDIVLGGAVTAVGDIALIADEDLQYGGDVTANGAVTSEGGSVDIAGNLIELNGDVSANGGDLTITGRTSEDWDFYSISRGENPYEPGYWGYIEVDEGKKLYASHDVFLIDAFGSGGDEEPPAGKMDLFGYVSLEIEAEGGEIKTEGPWGPDGVTITVEDTSPASLTMKQADPLNLVDYTFGNQADTDLTLESYNGSVTAVDSSQESQLLSGKDENAADQWLSITATAYTDITLQGHDASRDIKAKALTSNATAFDVGNIIVTSDNSKVLLTEDVKANQGSISLTAVDPDNGGIISSGNIEASDGITLFGEVKADKTGLQLFDARQGTLWAKDTLSTITKTGTGELRLAADTLVDLDGVDGDSGDSVDVQGGPLTIDGPVDAEGNLRASGVIHLTGPANLAGDVISTSSGITYEQAVIADGDTSQTYDAGTGELWVWENITKTNVGNLTLAGSLVNIDDTSGAGTSVSVTSGGSLTIEGPAEIDSDVSAEGITFEGSVTADGDTSQRFDAGSGTLLADENITKTGTDNLTLAGFLVDIDDLSGAGTSVSVTSGGSLTIEDPAEIDSDVSAEGITFNGTGKADGDTSQRFDALGGKLWAQETITKTTTGDLNLGGDDIDLDGTVDVDYGSLTIEDDFSAAADLIASDNITFEGSVGSVVNATLDGGDSGPPEVRVDQRIRAENGKFYASGWIHKTEPGNLNMFGGFDEPLDSGDYSVSTKEVRVEKGDLYITGNAFVLLDGDIYSKGRMELTSNDDGDVPHVDAGGTLEHASGTIKSLNNDIAIAAKKSRILLNGGVAYDPDNPDTTTYVKAGGDILLYSSTSIAADRKLDAGDDVALAADKRIVSNGSLTIEAGDDIMFGVDIATHEIDPMPMTGTAGDVSANGNLILDALDDVYAHGSLTATGDITISSSDSTTYLLGDLVEATGNVNLENNTQAADGIRIEALQGDVVVGVETEQVNPLDYPGMPGLIEGVYTDTYLWGKGALTVRADYDGIDDSDVIVGGLLRSDGALLVTADDNISVGKTSCSWGKMDMTADNGNITVGNLKRVYDLNPIDGDLVYFGGYVDTYGGNMTLTATNGGISFKSAYSSGSMKMDAGQDITAGVIAPTIWAGWEELDEVVEITQGGSINAEGNIKLYAGNDIKAKWINIPKEVDTGSVLLDAGHDILIGGVFPTLVADVYESDGQNQGSEFFGTKYDADLEEDVLNILDVYKGGGVWADGEMTLLAGNNIKLKTAQNEGGYILMEAGLDPAATEGDILVGGPAPHAVEVGEGEYGTDEFDKGGRLIADYGAITLTADRDISLKMAEADYDITMTADQDLTLRTNPGDYGADDRTESYCGDIRLRALNGDISIVEGYELIGGEFGYHWEGEGEGEVLVPHGGGVSLIADNGKIYSPGGDDDTLNVSVIGDSSQADGIGVELHPDMDNKAAIVIKSKADLKLGEGSELSAFGTYDTTGAVDDRAAVGLLDDGDPATATIGGILRDEGEPIDVAIYLASTEGDVDVSGPVTITSYNMDSQTMGLISVNAVPREEVHQGAMVIDAFDSVTFGELFEESLEGGEDGFSFVGDRLEVVSRITEWLFQAVGRLPYPYGGLPFPTDYAYVLRGAGLDNPDIAATTDGRGRAWVLEDPLPPAPLYEEAGQAVEPLTLGLAGCPVLVAAVSVELGVPGDTIQVSLANSFALNTNIQPCESCARLLNAATILRDEDGSGMAAMNQVFNTVAPAGAPFTPEMATSIATAFAGRVNDGTQYATAIEYIDAFVRYIAVLDTEMGSPVADGDSIAFLMGKYGTGITESDNSNIAAFVATRLESGETFGE